MRYLIEILRLPRTYVVAVVVGTLINLYGQLLVPHLRGVDAPLDALLREARLHPAVLSLSVALAYAFPLVVNVTSAMLMRLSLRGMERRAHLADEAPAPAFRADAEGRLVVVGSRTQVIFDSRSLRTAEEVLGRDLWEAAQRGELAGATASRYLPSLEGWYAVRTSESRGGLVNVYLAEIEDVRDGAVGVSGTDTGTG